MKIDPVKREKRRCEYHKNHGHDTDECIQLTNNIKELIRGGCIRRYVRRGDRPNEETLEQGREEPTAIIHMISGGNEK